MFLGGFVIGFSGLFKVISFQWYGWFGLEVFEVEIGFMREQFKEKYNVYFVFVDDELVDCYYNGFVSEQFFECCGFFLSIIG